MSRGYVWPAVVLAVSGLAAVVTLAALGKDATIAIGVLGTAILPLLAVLIAQLSAVREQTNGNASRMLSMLEEAHRLLAAAHVPTSALVPTPGSAAAGPDPGTASPGSTEPAGG
jgi:hypothetical protein